MLTRILSSACLATSLLTVSALAGSSDCKFETDNHIADYGPCETRNAPYTGTVTSEAGLYVRRPKAGFSQKSGPDFIDETAEERNQRSGN
jgi:hypothetical protein